MKSVLQEPKCVEQDLRVAWMLVSCGSHFTVVPSPPKCTVFSGVSVLGKPCLRVAGAGGVATAL